MDGGADWPEWRSRGHPKSAISFPQGASQFLAVAATGAEPLRYQWRFNGADLPGQTNASLVIANCQPGDAGVYVVRVSNDHGAVVSGAAMLQVVRPALGYTLDGNRLILEWPDETYKLQQSDTPAGGWIDVEPALASPFAAPLDRPAQFFRVVRR